MSELSIKQLIERIFDKKTNDGGLWLPKIQRNFVWTEEQICRLFDSVLREYPISSMLFWYNNQEMYYRDFIQHWSENTKPETHYITEKNKLSVKKTIVLDGQQRLQSFYIGLEGSYNKKKLYIDITSGEKKEPDDMMYQFAFYEPNDPKAQFPNILLKEIVDKTPYKRDREILQDYVDLVQKSGENLSQEVKDRISDNIETIRRAMDSKVTYIQLDSVNYPNKYTLDDVVEIFIRANSGGTKLSKSDLLFSLLISNWEEADTNMAELLEKINNKYEYEFTRDFILKTCLVLLDCGAEYNVEKFRKKETKEKLEQEWKNISKAIKAVVDFVHDNTYAKTDKALTSYLALIPLIYVYYKYPNAWKKCHDKDIYIIKAMLSGTFGGHSDTVINKIIETINKTKSFNVSAVFETMRNMGYSVDVTSERLFNQMGYDSKYVHLVLNILYKGINYNPALQNNLPQIDHIFPRSKLKEVKVKNPKTGRLWQKYDKSDINKLANCMILTQEENGRGGKTDTLPEDWFKNKPKKYLKLHCIPDDPKLWKISNYEKFLEKRQELLEAKLSEYIYKEE